MTSLSELELIASQKPSAKNFIKRLIGFSSYSEFVKTLYEDLEIVINEIQDGRPYVNRLEDPINYQITTNLKMMSWDAFHGTFSSGSTDIVVKSGTYKWIGEGKVFKGDYPYLYEGFLQLTTRYSIGSNLDNMGSLLIYFFEPNVSDRMIKWKSEFSELQRLNPSENDIRELIEGESALRFTSVHKHSSSGLDYTTKHFAIILQFKPKDKSGRKSKKYAESESEEE